jgi:hypothetical protein
VKKPKKKEAACRASLFFSLLRFTT